MKKVDKRVLNIEEIHKIREKMSQENFLEKSLIKDWTDFVINALSFGVSEFDIDQFSLSEEDFDKKYCI